MEIRAIGITMRITILVNSSNKCHGVLAQNRRNMREFLGID